MASMESRKLEFRSRLAPALDLPVEETLLERWTLFRGGGVGLLIREVFRCGGLERFVVVLPAGT